MKREFNHVPRIAWQIDIFGHSSVTPFLFEQMGFETIVINRIDSRLKQKLRREKKLEFQWLHPMTNHQNQGIFTHVLHKHVSQIVNAFTQSTHHHHHLLILIIGNWIMLNKLHMKWLNTWNKWQMTICLEM